MKNVTTKMGGGNSFLTLALFALFSFTTHQALAEEYYLQHLAKEGDECSMLYVRGYTSGPSNADEQSFVKAYLEYSQYGNIWTVVATQSLYGPYVFNQTVSFAIDPTGGGDGDVPDPQPGYYRIRLEVWGVACNCFQGSALYGSNPNYVYVHPFPVDPPLVSNALIVNGHNGQEQGTQAFLISKCNVSTYTLDLIRSSDDYGFC